MATVLNSIYHHCIWLFPVVWGSALPQGLEPEKMVRQMKLDSLFYVHEGSLSTPRRTKTNKQKWDTL